MRQLHILIVLIVFIPFISSAQNKKRVIHVIVALCDNKYQGIVPVPAKLGNGNDPANNLYWGALYGVKSFFKRSHNWKLVKCFKTSRPILERCIFKHRNKGIYLVADAYQGKEIKRAVNDFFDSAAGKKNAVLSVNDEKLNINGKAQLIVYIGHNALMDFRMYNYPARKNKEPREVIILACKSKQYFRPGIMKTGAKPLIWTTGFMAPEAYTLEAAAKGWAAGESSKNIRLRAAKAYSQYQKCSLSAAKRLLVSGM